jgi:hypothetical protein
LAGLGEVNPASSLAQTRSAKIRARALNPSISSLPPASAASGVLRYVAGV